MRRLIAPGGALANGGIPIPRTRVRGYFQTPLRAFYEAAAVQRPLSAGGEGGTALFTEQECTRHTRSQAKCWTGRGGYGRVPLVVGCFMFC